jgi:uncharacterized protein
MFIVDKPAMLVKKHLIIADIHLGITRDIWEKGIKLPSQVKILSDQINDLMKKTRAKKLVLLGDVKHHIPVINWQEQKEIPEFLGRLEFKKIILCKGNHDGNIERLVTGNVSVKKIYSFGNYAFTHGHRNVATKKKIIVIGHNQPNIRFRDKMKAVYSEPVWVKSPLNGKYDGKKLIMMPAFNELAGATIVNKGNLLGPIAKCIDPSRAHCYLLDGTDLGVINDLRIEV